ncbi:hypothetical protein QQ045_031604 [Rhodiola kirilowii]
MPGSREGMKIMLIWVRNNGIFLFNYCILFLVYFTNYDGLPYADWFSDMKADRDAHRAEMRAACSEWFTDMKADRDAHRSDIRSARSDRFADVKASSPTQPFKIQSARSDWFSDMNAHRYVHRADMHSAHSDWFSDMKADRDRDAYYSDIRSARSDSKPLPSEKVAPDADFKPIFTRTMESGKAEANRVYEKVMDVRRGFIRAMTVDPCDCQLKDLYKCVDEEGSTKDKCQSVMAQLFECRKNLKRSNSQKK